MLKAALFLLSLLFQGYYSLDRKITAPAIIAINEKLNVPSLPPAHLFKTINLQSAIKKTTLSQAVIAVKPKAMPLNLPCGIKFKRKITEQNIGSF